MQHHLHSSLLLATPLYRVFHGLSLRHYLTQEVVVLCFNRKEAAMKKIDLTEWPDWIDGQDVMTKLHITHRTLQRWRINGMLPFSNVNGKFYYRKSDILALLQRHYNGEKGEEQ